MNPDGTPAAILALLRDGRQQAQELAGALGVDTSAVRRHLEALRADGLVDAEEVRAGPGRPKKLYGVTPKGRETFPRDYGLLLGLVLAKLEEGGRAGLERIMTAVARDLGSPIAAEADSEARVEALVTYYNRLGFEASVEREPGGYVLTQRNCIFLKTAAGDPSLVCQCFDEGIMKAALPGAHVRFEGSLAMGAPRCRHVITTPERRACGQVS